MTANQIRYGEHLETKRHNRVSEVHEHGRVLAEQEKARAATTTAETGRSVLAESIRHNQETERQNWWNIQNQRVEEQRHNRETEGVQWYNAGVDERYKSRTAAVQERNAAVNERQASVGERQASVAERNARTNERNVQLGYSQLAESIRHNSTMEVETATHNRNVEAETNRSNLATELNRFGQLTEQRSYNSEYMGILSRREDTNARNAQTNALNASTNKINAATNARNANTREEELEHAKFNDFWKNVNGSISAAGQFMRGYNSYNKKGSSR